MEILKYFSTPFSGNIIERINSLDSSSLVLIDNKTLSNKSTMSAIKNSRARFCIKSPSGINKLRNTLNQQLNDLEIIALIPKTKREIKNVFGVEGDDVDLILKQMNKTEIHFEKIDHSTVINNAGSNNTMAEMLSLQLIAKPEKKKTYLIVGHNENGQLKFPDGSTSNINDIYKNISNNNHQGIILSCSTIDYSTTASTGVFTTRRLEFQNIAMSLEETASWARNTEQKTIGDFTVMLEQALKKYDDKNNRNIKIIYGAATGAGTSVVTAYIYVIIND